MTIKPKKLTAKQQEKIFKQQIIENLDRKPGRPKFEESGESGKVYIEPMTVKYDGKEWTPKEYIRECQLLGINYKTSEEWKDYLRSLKSIRQKRYKIKKRLREEAGQAAKDLPITNHPNSDHVMNSEDTEKKLRAKTRRAVIETVSTMEAIKKIAKSKIDKNILDKAKKSNSLDKEEIKEIDLNTLKDITNIILMASKAQLEAASKVLDNADKNKLRKSTKQEMTKKGISIDFNQLRNDSQELEKVKQNSSESDLLKSLDKMIN